MSTFCERSDRSINLKVSGKPKGRVIKPRGKTKCFPELDARMMERLKKLKTSKSGKKNDRYIEK